MRSTILISNLHCSSCVATIQETLSALSDPPLSIHTSIVSQSVTIEHSDDLHPDRIRDALDHAGFDLVSIPGDSNPAAHHSRSNIPNWLSRKAEKHAESCMLCRQEQEQLQGYQDNRPSSPVPDDHSSFESNLLKGDTNSSERPSISEMYETTHATHIQEPYAPSHQEDDHGPYHVTLSIGGMTCAACANTITRMVSEIPGASNVIVSLIGKSATVTVQHRDRISIVVETVEGCGFDCDVVSVEEIKSQGGSVKEPETDESRTIALRVGGMFCRHCPDKVMNSLKQFGQQISISGPLASYTDPNPILRLSYKPQPPHFTIRSIISAIATSKSPPFEVTIARPPSLEERARVMHAVEQRRLLSRLAVCFAIAIPTFIIGIVYMTLAPVSNTTRMLIMRPMWTGNSSVAQWALFFCATPVMFYSAGLFHRRSLKEIHGLWRKGSKTPLLRRFIRFGSMNLLVSMGVSIAYFASVVLLALAAAQPSSPDGMGDSTTYFDSVVFLTMFLLAGRYLEAYSKDRTVDAVNALGKLRPTTALLIAPSTPDSVAAETFSPPGSDVEKGATEVAEKGALDVRTGMQIEKVAVDLLEVGDIVRVSHGSTPPADGVVVSIEGGAFDESSLTGESKLVKKDNGATVFVGTINKGKAIDVKVMAVGGETMLDQIVKVVREGHTKRAPIERVADLLTGYFVPFITLLAIITWLIWLGLGLGGVLPKDYLDTPIGGWPVWSLEFAIAVFVVACPCGVGLAAPTALLVGSGLAAKFGILVRGGGEAFQEAAQLDIVVFDKTGTLTDGSEPRVTDHHIESIATSWNEDTVLAITAELESASSHPLAIAIIHLCEAKGPDAVVHSAGIEETPGRGLRGSFTVPRATAIIGNEAWMEDHRAVVSAEQAQRLRKWKEDGKSVILLALRDDTDVTPDAQFRIAATFAVTDAIRPEARDVIHRLQKQGLGTWMITGDNVATARSVAKAVGIPENNVIAGVLPHQKAEKVAWLQQIGQKRPTSRWKQLLGMKKLNERCIVAMVGDGINDAPALAAADVSLAIGSGSDVAISSASFILVKSNLYTILTLTDLSRKVFNRIIFNFIWAVMYNLAAVPIAAGAIYPAGRARLNPVWASLAMALSSTTVVMSSLLLKLYREPKK